MVGELSLFFRLFSSCLLPYSDEDTLQGLVDAMMDGDAVNVPAEVLEEVFALLRDALLVAGIILHKGNCRQNKDGTWRGLWQCSHYGNAACRCPWRVTLTSTTVPMGTSPLNWSFEELPDIANDHTHDLHGADVKDKLNKGDSLM
jgi:hypothetical protein